MQVCSFFFFSSSLFLFFNDVVINFFFLFFSILVEARVIGCADSEIPFGIGALNVLWMLRCHLMLFNQIPSYCPCCGSNIRNEYGNRQPFRGRHIRGFSMLLLDDRDAWMHLFALSFLVTAALWRSKAMTLGEVGIMNLSAGMSSSLKHSQSTGRLSISSHPTSTISFMSDAKAATSIPGRSNSIFSGSSGFMTVGDARLLEFGSILHEACEMILEALAAFPSDLNVLRATLYRRMRGMGLMAGGKVAVTAQANPSAWEAVNVVAPETSNIPATNVGNSKRPSATTNASPARATAVTHTVMGRRSPVVATQVKRVSTPEQQADQGYGLESPIGRASPSNGTARYGAGNVRRQLNRENN